MNSALIRVFSLILAAANGFGLGVVFGFVGVLLALPTGVAFGAAAEKLIELFGTDSV